MVKMQEVAQMAAWIFEDKDRNEKDVLKPRLLVSQNSTEIYLAFATYGKRYVDYLADRQKQKEVVSTDEMTEDNMIKMVKFGRAEPHGVPWSDHVGVHDPKKRMNVVIQQITQTTLLRAEIVRK